jgi:hypothetical protein
MLMLDFIDFSLQGKNIAMHLEMGQSLVSLHYGVKWNVP